MRSGGRRERIYGALTNALARAGVQASRTAMRRFDLDQLLMLVLVLATVMAVGIGFYSVRDDDGGASAQAEVAKEEAAAS